MSETGRVSGKSALIFSGITFILGVIVGYKLKGLRIRYLKSKQERLLSRLQKTSEDIRLATSS